MTQHTDASPQRSTPARPDTTTAVVRPRDLIVWGLWIGLVVGLIEVAQFAIERELRGRIVFIGRHVVWMAPVAWAILMTVVGGIVAAILRWIPALTSRVAVFGLWLPATMGPAIFYQPRLHLIAGLILSVGAAVHATRLVLARPAGFRTLVGRTLVPVVGIVALLAAGMFGYDAYAVSAARKAMGPARPGAPNVLLIVLDTVRAQSLSLYGYERRTSPELERFAKTGTRFDRAVATTSWTAPSHASMFTAQYPPLLSVNWKRPLDQRYPTVAGRLRADGYETSAFVANTLGCSSERGLNRGFVEYRDYPIDLQQLARSNALIRVGTSLYRPRQLVGIYDVLGRRRASEINDDVLGWLDGRQPGPFFAFVNYLDAHDPYMPPPPYDTMFGPNPRQNPWLVKRWWDPKSWTAADVVAEQKAYEGSIAYLDAQVGRLLAELQRRKLLDNTIVIITSDHGEEFGEHGRVGHGHGLYREGIHVPLIVSWPGRVPSGRVVTDAVSLRDLPATIMELTGTSPRVPFAGQSLGRFWQESPAQPSTASTAASHFGMWKSLMDGPYHYLKTARGREFVFNIDADPTEQRDLSSSPDGATRLAAMRQAFQTLMDGERAARRAAGKRAQ